MRMLPAVAVFSLLTCGCDEPAPDAADMMPPGEAQPLLDPRLFDCTSVGPDGMRGPERRSPVPPSCGTDPACRTPQLVGHRGAGGMLGRLAPEDTLSAYRAAIALGIEFGETDPRPTADGVIVNMHDPDVDRTTDGTGGVDKLSFAQVRALHVRAVGLPGDFSCERVPTLTEILQTCRGKLVVLVDANKTGRVDLLVQAIRDADALDWAIFDTSSVEKIDKALQLEPRLRFQIRPDTVDEIDRQLAHFAPRVPAIVEISAADFTATARQVHLRGARAMADAFAEDIQATLSGDVSGYGRMLDQGVDILQADRPDLALRLFRQRGLR